jgi:signal transduction histidine kinase
MYYNHGPLSILSSREDKVSGYPAANLAETLHTACRCAVEQFGADHGAYAAFDLDREFATVVAQFPAYPDAMGTQIPLKGVAINQQLIEERKPVAVRDVVNELKMGPACSFFRRLGIHSLVLIPVLDGDGAVVGSFSLNWTSEPWEFITGDDRRSALFGQLVGLAIQNATLYEQANAVAVKLDSALRESQKLYDARERRRELLEKLEASSVYLNEVRPLSDIHRDIVRLATELFGMKFCALYQNHARLRHLELVSHFGIGHFNHVREHTLGSILADVVRTGQSSVRTPASVSHYRSATDLRNLQSVAAVPVKYLGDTKYVLLLGDTEQRLLSEDAEVEVIERYAARAWVAIRASDRYDSQSDWISQAPLLNQMANFMQRSRSVDLIAHALLTSVTASFGLRFNRAILLLADTSRGVLRAHLSIGQLTHDGWLMSCESAKRNGLDDPGKYFEHLNKGVPEPTELHLNMDDFHQQILRGSSDMISRAWYEQRPIAVRGESWSYLSDDLRLRLSSPDECAIAPLLAGDECLGLVIVDNYFTRRSIQHSDLEALAAFCATAASILANLRLAEESKQAEERLRVLLRASERLLAPAEPNDSAPRNALSDILQQTQVAVRATGAGIILSADGKHASTHISSGSEPTYDPAVVMRPHGISSGVIRSRRPRAIPDVEAERDVMNSLTSWAQYCSAICLPLQVRGICLGVMWLLFRERRTFSDTEIDDLEHYANTTAHVYDNAQRRSDLYRLRAAAQALSQPFQQDYSERIPREAMLVAGADAVTFWPYSAATKQFLLEQMICIGLDREALKLPRQGGTTYNLLERNYHAVSDILSAYGEQHDLDRVQGLRAFQGVCLRAGHEPLGVLYLSYRKPRHFDEDDRKLLESFASFAAPFLNARRDKDEFNVAAETVARELVTGELDRALKVIVSIIRKVFRCGPVLLYQYDSSTQAIVYPPTMEGVSHPDMVETEDRSELEAMLAFLLSRDAPYLAENIRGGSGDADASGKESETIFCDTAFSAREQTRACAAFLLSAAGTKVGLLFVNYYEPRRFTISELETIELFANQAAIAVLYAQLHERSIKVLDNIAHELITPLMGIYTSLDGILKRKQGEITPLQEHWLKWAMQRTAMAIRPVENLKYLFHVQTGKAQMRMEQVRLDDVVKRVLDQFTVEFREDHIRATVHRDASEPIELISDAAIIENILTNLLANARKFTKPKADRLIDVTILRQSANSVAVAVADNGIGIPFKDQERVFERFFQVASHAQHVLGGAGIGLHIVKEYATLLGGCVTLTSEPGRGSCFTLVLPVRLQS